MMSPEYKRAAHRRTVLAHVQRSLREAYIDGPQPARETLICEEVFFADRVVDQEALLDIFNMLIALEQKEAEKMKRFTMREREIDVDAAAAAVQAQPDPKP